MRTRSASVFIVSAVLGMALSWAEVCGQSLDVDSSTSIESKIGEVPTEIIERYADRRQVVPANDELSTDERRKFSAALEVLTPLHETILRDHLRSISFVEGLPANAQTVRVDPGDAEPVFDLIFNARILDETLSEFATRKERQFFEAGDSQLTVAIVAGSMDAVAFVLIHEATHIVDMVLGLTNPTAPGRREIQETEQTPFARGVWENQVTPVSAYRSDLLENVPWPAGERVDIENAQALYEELERTPFVSIYASLMVVEDLAELVAWREMTEKHGQPYRIEMRNDTELVYSYEPMTSSLVRSRLNQLRRFDSPEK